MQEREVELDLPDAGCLRIPLHFKYGVLGWECYYENIEIACATNRKESEAMIEKMMFAISHNLNFLWKNHIMEKLKLCKIEPLYKRSWDLREGEDIPYTNFEDDELRFCEFICTTVHSSLSESKKEMKKLGIPVPDWYSDEFYVCLTSPKVHTYLALKKFLSREDNTRTVRAQDVAKKFLV